MRVFRQLTIGSRAVYAHYFRTYAQAIYNKRRGVIDDNLTNIPDCNEEWLISRKELPGVDRKYVRQL